MTEPTDQRPDGFCDAVRAARDDRSPSSTTSTGSCRRHRQSVAIAFADEVRAVRETMARVSASTALEPPTTCASGARRRRRRRGGGARSSRCARVDQVADGFVRRGSRRRHRAWAPRRRISRCGRSRSRRRPSRSSPHRTSAPSRATFPTGGTATVVFSRERNAGVLVMNNVEPPSREPCTRCGWSARTALSRRAPWTPPRSHRRPRRCCRPGGSTTLAFTVEPSGGSTLPTTPVFAQLPLI